MQPTLVGISEPRAFTSCHYAFVVMNHELIEAGPIVPAPYVGEAGGSVTFQSHSSFEPAVSPMLFWNSRLILPTFILLRRAFKFSRKCWMVVPWSGLFLQQNGPVRETGEERGAPCSFLEPSKDHFKRNGCHQPLFLRTCSESGAVCC